MKKSDMTAREWCEKGNEEYNKGKWSEALNHYTNALEQTKDENIEKIVYYKNRATAYLMLRDYEKVVHDCDRALKICYNDPRILFLRCRALETLERFEEAYLDAKNIILSDPNNKLLQSIAARLHENVQKRHKINSNISAEVSQMLDLAFNMKADKENRETAMNNLLVLACKTDSAEEIFKQKGILKIAQLVEVEKNEDMICSAICILGELCTNNFNRTNYVMTNIGMHWFLKMMNNTYVRRVNASRYCLQNVLNTYSGMDNNPNSKPNKALCETYKRNIDGIMSYLLRNTTNRTITDLAKDAIVQLIVRHTYCTSLEWTTRLVMFHRLKELVIAAIKKSDYKYKPSMDITSSTQTVTGVCLSQIYENMSDAARKKFSNVIDEFMNDKLLLNLSDPEFKMRAMVPIATLMMSPFDIGSAILTTNGILEILFFMAETNDLFEQNLAYQCIATVTIKRDKPFVISCQIVNILKKLYKSKHDEIRVRALVGLCMLNTFGNVRIVMTLFDADKTPKKLAEICRKFLINPEKDNDIRKWAIKALAYLSFDLEVKNKLIEDQRAIQAMIDLARTRDKSIFCGVIITLLNLCNAYVDHEVIPEIITYMKFIRHYIPVTDDDDFKNKRCVLAKAGVTSALLSLAITTTDQNQMHLIARIFNAICEHEELREMVVQQGGTETLLFLAKSGSNNGKNYALEALVKLGVTAHPKIRFPKEKLKILTRLFIYHLNPMYPAANNYKTIITLYKLSDLSNFMRKHIYNKGGFQKLEVYVHEEDDKLKRVAMFLINNLVLCPEVAVQCFEEDNNRIKYLLLLCKDKDKDTCKAAANTLVMLTMHNKKACEKVFDSVDWLESLRVLLANPNDDLQYKGIVIVRIMMESTKEVALNLIKMDIIMKLVTVLSKSDAMKIRVKKEAAIILRIATYYN